MGKCPIVYTFGCVPFDGPAAAFKVNAKFFRLSIKGTPLKSFEVARVISLIKIKVSAFLANLDSLDGD